MPYDIRAFGLPPFRSVTKGVRSGMFSEKAIYDASILKDLLDSYVQPCLNPGSNINQDSTRSGFGDQKCQKWDASSQGHLILCSEELVGQLFNSVDSDSTELRLLLLTGSFGVRSGMLGHEAPVAEPVLKDPRNSCGQ